jgi:uncharacterized protein YndB with AHSA1/START domain
MSEFNESVYIAAEPERVYRALTDPAEVRVWLAEDADIDLDAGRYELTGPSVPPGMASRLHKADRGRLVAIDMAGRVCTYELTPEDEGTQVAFAMTGDTQLEGGEAGIGHFWANSLYNLANHCEGRPVVPRFHFAAETGQARAAIDIAAAPSRVFAALTEADQVRKWCAGEPEIEAEIGGKYSFGWEHGGPVKILELEPDRRLSYSWEEPTAPGTVVTWELEGSQGRTRLTVVHSGFGDLRADGYSAGWLGFMMEMQRMIELGDSWRPVTWKL